MLRRRFVILVGAALALAAFSQACARAQGYTIMDLGTLGGTASRAQGINKLGHVVGRSFTSNNAADHAFLFRDANRNLQVDKGEMLDLLTLGGSWSLAFGIGNGGQVVGQTQMPSGNFGGDYHAFVWTESKGMSDLGTLGGSYSVTRAISLSGQAVGSSYTGAYDALGRVITGAFRTAPDSAINPATDSLGTLGGNSFASDINTSGMVVGSSGVTPTTPVRAVLWRSGAPIQDLGTLGGSQSEAYAINDAGQIAGYADTATGARLAFRLTPRDTDADGQPDLWYAADPAGPGVNTLMTPLGTLGGGSNVNDMNSRGQVVGYSYLSGSAGLIHAYLYTNGQMVDLNTRIPAGSGWELYTATAINDVGQIVGYGNHNGTERGFLLTPAFSVLITTDTQTLRPTVVPRAAYSLNVDLKQTAQLTIKVQDATGKMVADYPLKIAVSPDYTSGGHTHGTDAATAPRPHGWIFPEDKWPPPDFPLVDGPSGSLVDLAINTDSKGLARVRYIAPEFSGIETVTATSQIDPQLSSDPTTMTIRVGDLQELPADPAHYSLIGGPDDTAVSEKKRFEQKNHFGSSSLLQAITALAKNYTDEFNGPMPVNDMALAWGGLFDIGENKDGSKVTGPFWSVPHGGHRSGTNVDISIPVPNQRFEDMTQEQGWWPNHQPLKDPYIEAGHYHLTLQGKGSVTIKPFLTQVDWQDATNRVLQVFFAVQNRGGLDAQSVILTGVNVEAKDAQGSSVANGATLMSPPAKAQGDATKRHFRFTDLMELGSMPIRNSQPLPVGLQFQLAPNVTSVNMTLKGVADDTQGSFPIPPAAPIAKVSPPSTITVRPYMIVSVTLAPPSVKGGSPSTGTVTLNAPAPTGGTVVKVKSGIEKVAKLSTSSSSTPAASISLAVPAGATTANFMVTTSPVTKLQSVDISASDDSQTNQKATLTVTQ